MSRSNYLKDIMLIFLAFILLSPNQIQAGTTTVHFQIIDTSIRKITPVMICITDEEGKIHLPPDGRIPDAVSTTKDFFTGIDFENNKNWTGPVRKMRGVGNNEDRSFVYDLLLSIPYRTACPRGPTGRCSAWDPAFEVGRHRRRSFGRNGRRKISRQC